MKIAKIIASIIVFCFSSQAAAIDCSEFPSDRYPHSTGAGKKVGGILAMAVGIPASLVVGGIVGRSAADCTGTDEDGYQYCKENQRGWQVGLLTAGVLSTVSVVGGVSLLQQARGPRTQYRDWKRHCYKKNAKKRTKRGLRFKNVRYQPGKGTHLVGLNFEF